MSSKELVISQNRHESKVAILEDGQLVEVFFQRANEYSLAGSIHKGRVTRVLPGMQSAFVDLGLERDCFLYVSDFFEENADEIDRVGDERRSGRDRDREGERERERGGRGRDRDRNRSREQHAPAPVEAAPVIEEFEPAETLEGESAAPEAVAAAPAAEGEAPAGDRNQDRRGRRSRRRRRGGRGFPESKYATAGEPGNEPVDEVEPEIPEPVAEEIEPEIEAEAAPEPVEEVLLLPGESLAKYRRAPRQEPAPVVAESAPLAEASPEPEPEPILEPIDLDELQAAAEEAADAAAEQILDRVEEIEHRAEVAEAEVIDAVEPAVEAEDEADEAVVSESDEAVVEAAGEDQDAAVAEAIECETAEAVEGEAVEVVEGEALEAVEGEPSADEPQAQSATVREQSGRSPHRISRRMRRRGRGGRGQEAPAAEAPAEAAAETPVERPIERPVERFEARQQQAPERRERERERPPIPSIADLLREGQEIIVQIAKEPLGQKGARITSHIAMPGRYVVYMPTVEHLGVSRKISTDEERQRLKRILQKHREGVAGGFIMRTAGEGRSEEEIAADMQFLAALWLDIKQKAEKRRAPALLHHDVEVVQRLIRDQLTDGFKAIWVDNEDLYEQVLHSVERLAPALLSRVKMYTRPEPIFDAFGITQELEKALRPKVWLKSGGYIVINQTEALVAIDVNTGKYVGKSNRLEDTIVKTNLEAVKEIVRQMRLRDLGGIIVVDFIDMDERKNRAKVMQALEEVMRLDKAPYKILQFNDFGLVAITRKRVKQSLERALCSACPTCEGAGYVKSVDTVISEILTQAQKYAKVVDTKDVVLRVNPEVAKEMKSVSNQYLEELEEILGRPVLVTADPLLHQEKFDLA
ncbi:MAG: Rne/Rng family ribonuclease [Acidobacteria bacterium]|nr:Rne/Rng family ribonuclease [Acidobacteriota bacterium]